MTSASRPLDPLHDDLAGRRAVVMGLGLFSGGVETAKWLAARGADVVVTDLKEEAALRPSVEALEGLGVRFVLGGHDPEDFAKADLVVASPAVPREDRHLAIARDAGARVTTEVALFLAACPATVTGVTGSNGKSTTVSLLAAMLEADGRTVHLGGNIGRALINAAGTMAPSDEVVLELSSFQLEWTAEAGLHPRLAVVTNLTPNHLDRHGSWEAYRDAKAAVLPPPGDGAAAVVAWDDDGARALGQQAEVPVTWTSLEDDVPGDAVAWEGDRLVERRGGGETILLDADDVRLRGRFNLRNVASAAAAARLRGAAPEAVRAGARAFGGLPHRLEDCGSVGGVLCINDSKATTPDAAVRALQAVPAPVTALVGGYDKRIDLVPFARELARRARAVVLMGDTAPQLQSLLAAEDPGGAVRVETADGLEDAVERGLRLAAGAGTLLLSPGHASYGMFQHYGERGDRFRDAVRQRQR